MHIPETPDHIGDLDLMLRLAKYAAGTASYLQEDRALGKGARDACERLHAQLKALDQTVAPLLNKVTAREMSTFTSHDTKHARKVAHLMWLIIAPARRERLTPPEIGLLISAAYIHDLGMFLSDEERAKRLAPDSDLWDCLDWDPFVRLHLEQLTAALEAEEAKGPEKDIRRRAQLCSRLHQAQEALLCMDNRSRHAKPERYQALFHELRQHQSHARESICDIDAVLSFDGDSFRDKLISICVSHNEPSHVLTSRDPEQPERPLLPHDYPVGSATADLHFVAAALRLADILDFDRERTPPVLFHYFIPGALQPTEDEISALEWSKHLTITNWDIDHAKNEVVFRGRCGSYIVHHGVVKFCAIIAEEIAGTLGTFPAIGDAARALFALPTTVRADIYADGYTYVPYRFELDDDRIYQLLMGSAIYENPLDAIRELIQNAVDACLYRDAYEQLDNTNVVPRTDNRIVITYVEPTHDNPCPTLEVADAGCGMDEHTIDEYFLKVGRSFYNSPDFNQFRADLRRAGGQHGGHDFAPVSEFGIGFLSAFLLADKIEVETALWKPLRGDVLKRALEIHGPTRLMRMKVEKNCGPQAYTGTKVKLTLVKGSALVVLDDRGRPLACSIPPQWHEIQAYIEEKCVSLPYELCLHHVQDGARSTVYIKSKAMSVTLEPAEERHSVRVPVHDVHSGLKGEIALVNQEALRSERTVQPREAGLTLINDFEPVPPQFRDHGRLVRGGFLVGGVPGMPGGDCFAAAMVSLVAAPQRNHRYHKTNLARASLVDTAAIGKAIFDQWFGWMLNHHRQLPIGLLRKVELPFAVLDKAGESVGPYHALSIYALALDSWRAWAAEKHSTTSDEFDAWERSADGAFLPYKYGSSIWHVPLLNTVLPSICRLRIDCNRQYSVSAPESGWQEKLGSRQAFIATRQPQSWDFSPWGSFADYDESVSGCVWFRPGKQTILSQGHLNVPLNAQYETRLRSVFSPSELASLANWFNDLLESCISNRPVYDYALHILHRAQAHLGDLIIRDVDSGKSYRIDSFSLPPWKDAGANQ